MDERLLALEQHANAARKMWAAVVLAAVDDAIRDNRKTGKGTIYLRRWLSSRDGAEVLHNAGLDAGERVTAGLVAYVERGALTSGGLTRPQ